jgi:hypothetical protein
MSVPNDPAILLSFINTKLRDFYSDLDALCYDLELDKEIICKKLEMIGYEYKPERNQFV